MDSDAVLWKVAEGDVVSSINSTGVVLFLACDELEEGGLACSVGTDKTNAVFGADCGGGIAEEIAFAVLEGYVAKC